MPTNRAMLRFSLIAGIVLALALPLAAQQDNSGQQGPPASAGKSAQQKKDQPKNAPKDSPQNDSEKKSAAQENPFPRAQSEAAAQKAAQPQNPGSAPNAPQPQTSGSSSAKPSSTDQNPFPEAQSEKAAHQSEQQQNPPPPPGAKQPSDDESFSSSQVKGLDMPTTDEQPPENLPPSPLPYDPKLARKDANIGDFYMETGDWKGAYDRFLEANRSDPGNAEAVYGLAESARRIGHRDEALRMYRLYLSALPRGPHAKEIHKALREMGVEH